MTTQHLITADVREALRALPANSVQCVVCSPPYWSLRDYSLPPQIWGGDSECEHEWEKAPPRRRRDESDVKDPDSKQATNMGANITLSETDNCIHCTAWRGSLGLEPTPEQFTANIVEVFREVRRVLRPDGVMFVNLGDSYATHGGCKGSKHSHNFRPPEVAEREGIYRKKPYGAQIGLKEKDLVGIPWRVAFALQADGWWLRSDIIWAKPNPMPESCTDRPTKSHEYVFLLTKKPRYFWDADAVREKAEYGRREWSDVEGNLASIGGGRGHATVSGSNPETGRNIRTVWNIATQAFSEAHFATYPYKLVERCLLAGTSAKGCCAECGAPWARVVEVQGESTGDKLKKRGYSPKRGDNEQVRQALDYAGGHGNNIRPTKTTGWRATCQCESGVVPCTVLDPFSGAATTGVVALRMGLNYIGIDLSAEYTAMAEKRIADECGSLFTEQTLNPFSHKASGCTERRQRDRALVLSHEKGGDK